MEHHSLILRPLKDVDMYLQENKRTNLRLAIAHLDGDAYLPWERLARYGVASGAPLGQRAIWRAWCCIRDRSVRGLEEGSAS